jgi:hypothetical protein
MTTKKNWNGYPQYLAFQGIKVSEELVQRALSSESEEVPFVDLLNIYKDIMSNYFIYTVKEVSRALDVIKTPNKFKAYILGYKDTQVAKADWIVDKHFKSQNARVIVEALNKDHYRLSPFFDEDTNVSAKAFNIKYIKGTADALLHLKRFFEVQIIDQFNHRPEEFYALYTSFAQSSGYGKSRILFELGKLYFNVAYLCLREDRSTGYPPGHAIIRNILKNASFVEMKIFIVACYLTAKMFVEEQESAPSPPLKSLCKDFQKLDSFWQTVKANYEDLLTEDHDSVFKGYRILQIEEYRKRSEWKASGETSYGKNLYELIIVFDEARFLIDESTSAETQFRLLRRAQRELSSRTVALVFVDTLSTITNFSPSKIFDPSYRPESGEFKLLPPYYELQTYVPTEKANELVNGSIARKILEDDKLKELGCRFSIGRPLWYAYYFNESNYTTSLFNKAVKFARIKLSFDISQDIMKSSDALLAVFSVRFGAKGIMDHTMASRLMSSYMATGIYLGDDRLRMLARYVPEPILAEAACQLLYLAKIEDKSFALLFDPDRIGKCITNFLNPLVNGFVDVGELGEFISRLILSLTYDAAKMGVVLPEPKESKQLKNNEFDDAEEDESIADKCPLDEGAKNDTLPLMNINTFETKSPKAIPEGLIFSDFFNYSIDCSTFLDFLISKKYAEFWKETYGVALYSFAKDEEYDLAKARIVLTSWIHLEDSPGRGLNNDFLKQCYMAGVGVVMSNSHRGCDLVIPLQVNETEYSFIIIQCRLRDGVNLHTHLKSAGPKLTPSYCFSSRKDVNGVDVNTNDYSIVAPKHYLAIYMDLGADQFYNSKRPDLENEKLQVVKHSENYPNHIVLLGLNYGILNFQKLRENILVYRSKKVDFINVENRFPILKAMDPLTYAFTGKHCGCKEKRCVIKMCGCRFRQHPCWSKCACQGQCDNQFNNPGSSPSELNANEQLSGEGVGQGTVSHDSDGEELREPELKKLKIR